MKKIENQDTTYLSLFQEELTQEQHNNILKWIEALESNKYEQWREQLRTRLEEGTYGFCCLGVANEVCELGTPPSSEGLVIESGNRLGLKELKFEECLGSFDGDGYTLASLNDDDDWSFFEIANLLRDQLKFSTVVPEGGVV